MSGRNMMRALAATAGVLLVGAAAAPGMAATRTADSGDVQATVRKTVLQTATATGETVQKWYPEWYMKKEEKAGA